MSVAYEFLHKEDKFGFPNCEEMLNFIIDNYVELMDVYRVMKAQNILTKETQEWAAEQLDELRKRAQTLNPNQMTEAEKEELEERNTYFTELREQTQIHHYNGNPLEVNQLTMLIINHPTLMSVLERCDSKSRNGLSKISPKIIEIILYPISFLTRSSIENTPPESKKCLKVLKTMRSAIASVPNTVSEMFLKSMEINLDEHIPQNNDEDESEEQSYNIEL